MYEDHWVPSARKFYEGLGEKQQGRVDRALDRVLQDPVRAPNVEPLKGEPRRYRLRIGDLRLIYRFDSKTEDLFVLLLDNRKDAY
jgi:mRNA-degrading endonuclease RelE of RelBE toxin-antitoxin system